MKGGCKWCWLDRSRSWCWCKERRVERQWCWGNIYTYPALQEITPSARTPTCQPESLLRCDFALVSWGNALKLVVPSEHPAIYRFDRHSVLNIFGPASYCQVIVKPSLYRIAVRRQNEHGVIRWRSQSSLITCACYSSDLEGGTVGNAAVREGNGHGGDKGVYLDAYTTSPQFTDQENMSLPELKNGNCADSKKNKMPPLSGCQQTVWVASSFIKLPGYLTSITCTHSNFQLSKSPLHCGLA